MLPVIETPRLLLHPVCQEDLDVLYTIWTDPEVRRYLWDDIVIPRERAQQVLDDHFSVLVPAGLGFWTAQLHDRAGVIGFCGLRFFDDVREIELMYGLVREFWKQGLATEAARAMLDYVWRATTYSRVWARTDPPNAASVEVMRRLGMRHDNTTGTMISYVSGRPAAAVSARTHE